MEFAFNIEGAVFVNADTEDDAMRIIEEWVFYTPFLFEVHRCDLNE